MVPALLELILVGAVALLINAVRVRDFAGAPEVHKLAEYLEEDEDTIKYRFVPNLLDAYDVNEGELSRKARSLFLGQAVLGIFVSIVVVLAFADAFPALLEDAQRATAMILRLVDQVH